MQTKQKNKTLTEYSAPYADVLQIGPSCLICTSETVQSDSPIEGLLLDDDVFSGWVL